MTVTLPIERKRCAEEELGTSVQTNKKTRVLESLLGSPRLLFANSPAGSACNQGNNGTKTQKKRCRPGDAGAAAGAQQQEPSPPASSKRGKRADGSNTAAQSPRATAAALQELLTCEGLEKDPDLEVQQAYVSRQLQQRQAAQQQPGAAAASGAADDSGASRVSHEAPGSAAPAARRRRSVAAVAANDDAEPQQEWDAAKSSRGRDQAPQHGRSRDQVSRRPAAEAPEQAHTPPPADEDEEDGERATLDLVPDKEWQRLFAVLTLSGQPRSGPSSAQQQQQAPAAAQQQPAAVRPNYSAGASTSAAAAAAAAPPAAAAAVAADAPSTPTRREGETQAAAAAAVHSGCVTPSAARRGSFLLGEFSRVQARLTPEKERTQLGTPGSRQQSAMEVTC